MVDEERGLEDVLHDARTPLVQTVSHTHLSLHVDALLMLVLDLVETVLDLALDHEVRNRLLNALNKVKLWSLERSDPKGHGAFCIYNCKLY